MDSWISFSICIAGLWLLSFLGAWALFRHLGRKSGRVRLYPPIGILRLRADSGVYRCRYHRVVPAGWVVGAPLRRDHHVPLRPGESVVVEAPVPGGVQVFRSEVLDRIAATHELVLRQPTRVEAWDRRSEPRTTASEGALIKLNGEMAGVVDAAPNGLRVLTLARLEPGEAIRLRVDGELRDGWVLECLSAVWHGVSACEARIRLQPIDAPAHRPSWSDVFGA